MIIAEIEEHKLKKEETVKQMEVLKEEILKELSAFLKRWYAGQTKSSIKDNADVLIELGKEKAKELKGDIDKLISESEEVVASYFNSEEIWWHTEESHTSYYHSPRKIFPRLEDPLKVAQGELGIILLGYGLDKPKSRYSQTWIEEHQKTKYAYGIAYPDKLCELSGEYIALISKAQKINQDIKSLEKKMKEENIEDWWDSL